MATNPELVVLARESRGMTQSELAAKAGVTQGFLSKLESGLVSADAALVDVLADRLGFPSEFFEQGDRVYGYGSPCLYHRKQKTMPAKVLRQLQATSNIVRLEVRNLCRGVDIDAALEFPSFDIDEFPSPEAVAGLLRRHWRIPMGPVANLSAIVEAAGGILVQVPFGTRQLDAVSIWPPGEAPLFLLNQASSWDRLRFTLAHEVGHMVMHANASPTMEDEADRFAAELLMPAHEIADELKGLRLDNLPLLKARWRVSMAALCRQAFRIGAISRDQYRRLFMRLGQLGYRKAEPGDLQAEVPTTLAAVIDIHLREHGMTVGELSQLARCSETDFRHRYLGSRWRVISGGS